MTQLPRDRLLATLNETLRLNPVGALIGPKQSGKTTLAKVLAGAGGRVLRPGEPADLRRLSNPWPRWNRCAARVVIDEIQRQPSLFAVLRVLAERRPAPAKFLVLSSASPDLTRDMSATLAGRVGFVEMGGFSLGEVEPSALRQLWWRGGFPPSFLAESDAASRQWREHFVQTFLEGDLKTLGVQTSAASLCRLWHHAGPISRSSCQCVRNWPVARR